MIRHFVYTFLFLGFIFNSTAFAGIYQDEKINKKDSKGKKQGKWIYFGKDRPEEGYPASGKVEEGAYKDDRKEGVWIKYYNDGVTPRLKGEYVNNRPQGSYVKIYPNGKVKEVGTFERNQYKDSLVRFYDNGVKEYEAKFNDSGKEQGSVKYYFANGQLEFEYISQNGKPVGKATRYYENGDIKESIVYAADGSVEKSDQKEMVNPTVKIVETNVSRETAPKIVSPITKGIKFQANGYNKVFNINDEIWQDGTFKNGQLWEGKVYEYDKDGILLKVKVFKGGVYHSDGQL
jgi:antitoxin component YwqK of YwqJK toxin-antitoxin module